MLRLMADYLTNRKMRLVVNKHTTEWVESLIGTPQGGILSTVNTNIYSSDCDNADAYLHGEFADDNIKLETDLCELKALRRLQPRINQFLLWCSDQNISYTMDKIQLIVFRPPSAPRPYRSLAITVDDDVKHETDLYKILGTFISSDLNFDYHFSVVTKRAYAALHQARSFVTNNKQPVIRLS